MIALFCRYGCSVTRSAPMLNIYNFQYYQQQDQQISRKKKWRVVPYIIKFFWQKLQFLVVTQPLYRNIKAEVYFLWMRIQQEQIIILYFSQDCMRKYHVKSQVNYLRIVVEQLWHEILCRNALRHLFLPFYVWSHMMLVFCWGLMCILVFCYVPSLMGLERGASCLFKDLYNGFSCRFVNLQDFGCPSDCKPFIDHQIDQLLPPLSDDMIYTFANFRVFDVWLDNFLPHGPTIQQLWHVIQGLDFHLQGMCDCSILDGVTNRVWDLHDRVRFFLPCLTLFRLKMYIFLGISLKIIKLNPTSKSIHMEIEGIMMLQCKNNCFVQALF